MMMMMMMMTMTITTTTFKQSNLLSLMVGVARAV